MYSWMTAGHSAWVHAWAAA